MSDQIPTYSQGPYGTRPLEGSGLPVPQQWAPQPAFNAGAQRLPGMAGPAMPPTPPMPPMPPMPVGLPQQPVLQSRSYAAPLSFVGSARRISAAGTSMGNAIGIPAPLGAILLSTVLVPFAWIFVACWYFVIFGLFGVFTFPFRLMRRGQRKTQHLAQVQLASTQAMVLQQQQAHAAQQAWLAQQQWQQQQAWQQQQWQWQQQQLHSQQQLGN